MGTEMPYGPSYKLPNLLVKCVAMRPEIPAPQRQLLVKCIHIPLDSYTIQALRAWFTLPQGGRIPSGATMKFINDLRTYEAFQNEIRQIADIAGVPPITFDYLAWDAGHHQTESTEITVSSSAEEIEKS
jgi:hypothetical protein